MGYSIDGIKFEFNDTISLYTINNSELRRFAREDILYYIYIVVTYN